MASPAYSNWQEMPRVSLTCHLTETPLSSHVLDSWAYCLSGPIGEPHPWVVSASWLGICCYLKVLWQNIQSCSSLGVTQGGNCSGNIGDFLEGQSLLLPLDWCPGSVRGAVLVGWLGGLLQSAAIYHIGLWAGLGQLWRCLSLPVCRFLSLLPWPKLSWP